MGRPQASRVQTGRSFPTFDDLRRVERQTNADHLMSSWFKDSPSRRVYESTDLAPVGSSAVQHQAPLPPERQERAAGSPRAQPPGPRRPLRAPQAAWATWYSKGGPPTCTLRRISASSPSIDDFPAPSSLPASRSGEWARQATRALTASAACLPPTMRREYECHTTTFISSLTDRSSYPSPTTLTVNPPSPVLLHSPRPTL